MDAHFVQNKGLPAHPPMPAMSWGHWRENDVLGPKRQPPSGPQSPHLQWEADLKEFRIRRDLRI